MFVIGLTGKAGAGKTTLAKYIRDCWYEDYSGEVYISPFAQSLKELALYIGWDGIKDERGRRLLQLLGTDVCRKCIDDNYWINKWLQTVSVARSDNAKMIIADDVRFPNELEAIDKLGGVVYKIIGRNYIMGDAENHESEQDLQCDNIINNNSTLAALRLKAKTIIDNLLIGKKGES